MHDFKNENWGKKTFSFNIAGCFLHNSVCICGRSPAMAGGLFAIERDFFFELGLYDPGLQIWGGENFEISYKVSMNNRIFFRTFVKILDKFTLNFYIHADLAVWGPAAFCPLLSCWTYLQASWMAGQPSSSTCGIITHSKGRSSQQVEKYCLPVCVI